jgi:hypothetical protein
MRLPFALLSLSVAALVALDPVVARADPTFPMRIQTHLGLKYTPPCNICHTSPLGFPAPASQPFALAMKANGLVAPDPDTKLEMALDALAASMQDSDCDKTDDIMQLQAGRDPNPPGEYIDGSGKSAPPPSSCAGAGGPTFGCGAQLSPAAPASGQGAAALLASVGALWAGLVRRRRR